MLLAYYIAAVNIETTYHGLVGGEYQPFDGIVLTDTFQIIEAGDTADIGIFPANNERIERQLADPDHGHRRQPAVLGRPGPARTTTTRT